ncbi:hypothetical protein [Lysinibacillus sphaericus]|nr:hypothetical protein [Lysinibacillus sp. SDF0037]
MSSTLRNERGGSMQITDGTWIFDSETIDEAAKKLQRDEQEREMLNAFARYAYLRYKQIRDCVNPRKCKYMRIDQVREQLKSPAKVQKVSSLFNISEEEVHYIVDFVKKYLKYVK